MLLVDLLGAVLSHRMATLREQPVRWLWVARVSVLDLSGDHKRRPCDCCRNDLVLVLLLRLFAKKPNGAVAQSYFNRIIGLHIDGVLADLDH